MATTPKTIVEKAKLRSQELLDFNNNASSKRADKLLSILEAGEGSAITRDLLDHFLHNEIEAAGHSPNYTRAKLRQCLSIKEKIALVNAENYLNATGVAHGAGEDPRDLEIRTTLNETICNLEKHFLNNRDFTESRILRNAAFNQFEIKPRMELKDRHNLNETTLKVKKLCLDNGMDTLAESTDFTNESDAQKIWKIADTLTQLSGVGVQIDADMLKKFEELHLRIKPLRDLDKHYQHVTKALNMLQRNAQKGYHAMVRPNQVKKMKSVLEKLGLLKEYDQKIIAYNHLDNFDKNEEHTFLDNFMEKVKANPELQKALYAEAIGAAEFTEWFYSASAYTLVNTAKLGLDGAKGTAFGDRLAHVEAETQSRRGLVRRRLFDIARRIPGGPNGRGDFASDVDFETANSYFEKFRDLFFVKEEDNYRDGANVQQYDEMRKLLAAITRRRVPALASSHRIRRGHVGRITLKWIENALKGTDRGIRDRVRAQWHHADDAEVVAMVIMFQNQATNQVFYQDHKKDANIGGGRFGKVTNKIALAERFRDKMSNWMSPKAKKILTVAEETAKKSLQLGGGGLKLTNKIGSKATRGLSRGLGALSGKYNTMIKNGGYKRWKTPFYLPYLVTAPTEGLSKLTYKGATYMDREGNNKIQEYIVEPTEKGYAATKDIIAKGTGQETNYLFQGLTYATEQVSSLAGQGVAATGQRFHDTYSTGQQRSILGAFYAAAKEEKGLADLMQSSELADLLNFKERGPRLFDEDGRSTMTERVAEKDKTKEAGKLLSKTIEKQLEELTKGLDDKEDMLSKKLESATNIIEQNNFLDKKSQLENRRGDVINIRIDIEQLIGLMKDPVGNQGAIETIIGQAANQQGGILASGIKAKISNLQTATTARKNIINGTQTQHLGAQNNNGVVNRDKKADLQREISDAQSEIDKQNNTIANNTGKEQQQVQARTAAGAIVKSQEARKRQAEQRIYELNQELMDLSSREGRLKKVSAAITTLRDDQNQSHLNEETLKSLANSLDLTLYKPSRQQVIQKANNALNEALAA